MKNKKPWIIFTKYSPYMVIDLERFKNSKNEDLPVQPVMSLCRCGASNNRPYCDGSHSRVGFVGEKTPDRVPDRVKEYNGRDITIVDNRGVCSHSQACIKNLPSIFRTNSRPWIYPNGASVKP